MRELPDDVVYFDGNGCLTERIRLGDQAVVVHYDDIPDQDRTVVDGIPCTTALRTVIDIAPDCERDELERIVRDFLDRRLFTIQGALARIAEPDMLTRPGAILLLKCMLARRLGTGLATADPHLLELCRDEGIATLPLPDSRGTTWAP